MLEKIKQYKETIALVLAVIAVYLWVGSAKITNVQAEENKKAIDLLTAMVMKHDGSIETMMVMKGIDPDSAKKWSKIPRAPVTDSLGNLITDVPWVQYKYDMQLAILYKFIADGDDKVKEVVVDTLYDIRER